MHSPEVVVADVNLWPRSRLRHWRPAATIWHMEPGGADALSVCGRSPDGTRHDRWKWHVHHWRITFPPLKQLRRRLLTRCEYCGGRSTRTRPVNCTYHWEDPPSHWWQGEKGLHHAECMRQE